MKPIRWIVVGTDFSPASGGALLRAAALANELGAAIACTHAYEDAPGASPQSDPTDALMARLEEVAAGLRARFPSLAVQCFVRRGAPWEKLVNVACELGADLIVVGTSGGHSRPSPRFVGSVVTRIAATSNRSLLVVPDPDASVFAPAP